MAGDRRRLDAALARLLLGLAPIASALPRSSRGLLRSCGAALATLTWPWSSVRTRAGGRLRQPWRWGASLADNAAAALGATGPLSVAGWPDGWVSRPTVVLAAHLGNWERGAIELARRGVRPLVIVAPWPRLPRTAAAVASLRMRHGVATVARGRAGLIAATHHLRTGGWVVVLVDSISPTRARRRPLPFGAEPVGAPDALVAWAGRSGAGLLVSELDGDGVRLSVLSSPGAARRPAVAANQRVANAVVATLRAAVVRAPARWAWVRPLAGMAVAVLVGGCAGPSLPPLPLDPEAWQADIEGLSWSGTLDGGQRLEIEAGSARVRPRGEGFVGAFEAIEVVVDRDQPLEVAFSASSAAGSLPAGPLTFRGLAWTTQDLSGELPVLVWAEGRWTCDGCSLERVLSRLGAPPGAAR